jgi:hypothetical protein
MTLNLAALGLATLAGLAACAAPADTAGPAAGEVRVLVKLARPSDDAAAIVRQASAAAGTPVRYLAATSLQWHALGLRCGSAADCDAALQRLRADAAHFEAVQRDERKRPSTS